MEVRNRVKGLDLIERVTEELWTEVHDIVQEAGIKRVLKKNKCKKAKWLSEEALQITEKRREGNGKEEKRRYTHLNAEFQRIARTDKKAFLRDQCKEVDFCIYVHQWYWPVVFFFCGIFVRSIPFLSFIKPIFTWNVPLASLIFLKWSLVFPILLFSSISLDCSVRKPFLSLIAILWNSVLRWI